METEDEVRGMAAAMDALTQEIIHLRAERDQLVVRVGTLETELCELRRRARGLLSALALRLVGRNTSSKIPQTNPAQESGASDVSLGPASVSASKRGPGETPKNALETPI